MRVFVELDGDEVVDQNNMANWSLSKKVSRFFTIPAILVGAAVILPFITHNLVAAFLALLPFAGYVMYMTSEHRYEKDNDMFFIVCLAVLFFFCWINVFDK